MTTAANPIRVSPSWLALREPADAAARARDLVAMLRRHVPARGPVVVHDLACGTGSMLRWLGPQLPGPQVWVCYDRDAELLAIAAREEQRARDGSPVTVLPRRQDVTGLATGACADATLITTSALLDLLTTDELDRVVGTCADAGCPALLTLSVTGRVQLWPADPFDTVIQDAFNAHQRRGNGSRRLLGPDAADRAVRAFRRRGAHVTVRARRWRLGPATRALTAEWFTGWLAAACEQRPELRTEAVAYARRRLADAASGRLRVAVHHCDLLVEPPTTTERDA